MMGQMHRLAAAAVAVGLLVGATTASGREPARASKEDSREWRADRESKRSTKPGDERPHGMSMRPGSYLAPGFQGRMIGDYARYRLRPPPRGYAWFQSGAAFLLVSLTDGQVFDIIE